MGRQAGRVDSLPRDRDRGGEAGNRWLKCASICTLEGLGRKACFLDFAFPWLTIQAPGVKFQSVVHLIWIGRSRLKPIVMKQMGELFTPGSLQSSPLGYLFPRIRDNGTVRANQSGTLL